MYQFQKMTANRANYGGMRDTGKIRYLVIHYTGNDGDTAQNNGKYFRRNIVKASAHYFVDDDYVVQSVPDNRIAYAIGGKKYADISVTGGGKYHGRATNANSLSIELCDQKRNGKVYPSDKTIANALTLAKKLMKKYGIPQEHVIRHFDVTGKSCPAYWSGTTQKNKKWKTEFWNLLVSKKRYGSVFPVLTGKGYLAESDKGVQVKRLQAFLNWYGEKRLIVDGSFGPDTKEAVRDFQKKENLKADGFFGPQSLLRARTVKRLVS